MSDEKLDADGYFLAILFIVAAIPFVVGPIVIVGWQIFNFLQTGDWTSISIITVLSSAGFEWATNPTTWIGLHKVLDAAPLSFTLAGFAFIYWWTA